MGVGFGMGDPRLPSYMSPNSRRRQIRATPSPLDKCTIVSILPKPIVESKHTIFPGLFEISPGSFERPAVLVVGPSSWWQEGADESMPITEILTPSPSIAGSIVNDYCNGLLGCDMGEKMPGLFFVQGEHSMVQVIKNYADQLQIAKRRQDNWFGELVRISDILWARTNGNPICISEDAKLAATQLGLKEKPWMMDFQSLELIACVGCGGLRNPKFPICAHCHNVIDAELYKKLGIMKAS